jgi:lipid II:glycine glycyltransferase (peptidoglycan interpeptide bridge formation enzyme)
MPAVVTDVAEAPDEWDRSTVGAPGGHVLQGRAWAEHRREQGWQAHHLSFDDGRAALVLTRAQHPMPGFLAYAPRGPVSAGDKPAAVAGRAVALADWVRARGGTLLVVDPQVDADAAYDAPLRQRGFVMAEEVQASRHRMLLPFVAGMEPDALFRDVGKSTRQRIRAAEKAGTRVHEDRNGQHLELFGRLLDATADRRDFYYGSMSATARWWRRAMQADQARFWVALHDDRVLGGLFVYLQGGTYQTAYSGDEASLRRAYPGTMHLLRWTVIREAMLAGAQAIDLGGVDVPGQRRRPERGDTLWGLYEHKASFGAQWVESASAHRIVIRPWLERAGRLSRVAYRSVTRRRAFPGAGRSGRVR